MRRRPYGGKCMATDGRHKEQDLQMYRSAFAAHDVRFDGRVYMGVSSTGIYCRPVCSARLPKAEHCTFFTSAAAAEAAGYRPCLKCRPELAPGCAPVDAEARLAQRAATCMENGLWEGTLQGLAQSLGVTDRHLRRAFVAAYGVSPIQYLQTQRLLLAKHLLTDTDLPVAQVAFAAGFGSVRRHGPARSMQAAGCPATRDHTVVGIPTAVPMGQAVGVFAGARHSRR